MKKIFGILVIFLAFMFVDVNASVCTYDVSDIITYDISIKEGIERLNYETITISSLTNDVVANYYSSNPIVISGGSLYNGKTITEAFKENGKSESGCPAYAIIGSYNSNDATLDKVLDGLIALVNPIFGVINFSSNIYYMVNPSDMKDSPYWGMYFYDDEDEYESHLNKLQNGIGDDWKLLISINGVTREKNDNYKYVSKSYSCNYNSSGTVNERFLGSDGKYHRYINADSIKFVGDSSSGDSYVEFTQNGKSNKIYYMKNNVSQINSTGSLKYGVTTNFTYNSKDPVDDLDYKNMTYYYLSDYLFEMNDTGYCPERLSFLVDHDDEANYPGGVIAVNQIKDDSGLFNSIKSDFDNWWSYMHEGYYSGLGTGDTRDYMFHYYLDVGGENNICSESGSYCYDFWKSNDNYIKFGYAKDQNPKNTFYGDKEKYAFVIISKNKNFKDSIFIRLSGAYYYQNSYAFYDDSFKPNLFLGPTASSTRFHDGFIDEIVIIKDKENLINLIYNKSSINNFAHYYYNGNSVISPASSKVDVDETCNIGYAGAKCIEFEPITLCNGKKIYIEIGYSGLSYYTLYSYNKNFFGAFYARSIESDENGFAVKLHDGGLLYIPFDSLSTAKSSNSNMKYGLKINYFDAYSYSLNKNLYDYTYEVNILEDTNMYEVSNCRNGIYNGVTKGEKEIVNSCPLGYHVTKDIVGILKVFRIIVPLIAIIVTIIDIIKLITKDDIMGSGKKTKSILIKRILYTITFFFVPTLVLLLFDLIGLEAGCYDELVGSSSASTTQKTTDEIYRDVKVLRLSCESGYTKEGLTCTKTIEGSETKANNEANTIKEKRNFKTTVTKITSNKYTVSYDLIECSSKFSLNGDICELVKTYKSAEEAETLSQYDLTISSLKFEVNKSINGNVVTYTYEPSVCAKGYTINNDGTRCVKNGSTISTERDTKQDSEIVVDEHNYSHLLEYKCYATENIGTYSCNYSYDVNY